MSTWDADDLPEDLRAVFGTFLQAFKNSMDAASWGAMWAQLPPVVQSNLLRALRIQAL